MNQMNNISTTALSKPSNGNGQLSWPKASSIKQSFSLPSSIIYYIAKNPSTAEVYRKLTQSCKYFFEKNHILIVQRVNGDENKFCSNDDKKCHKMNRKCCVSIDVSKITSKIWLTDQLRLTADIIPETALLLPFKLYRCENAILNISFTRIPDEQFQLFASKFQKYELQYVSIMNHDGSFMMLERIIESISNLKEFDYHFNEHIPSHNPSTIKNISKLMNLRNLQKLSFQEIPEIFPVLDFGHFIKNHKNTKLYSEFNYNMSNTYKMQLDALIHFVIITKTDCIIYYNGQDERKCDIMETRYFKKM